jgi:DNA polymerase-3 subunit epsilon
MKRQIVLDTETTGIGHESGHRLIEIGCVELIDRRLTGRHYHQYLNPERAVDSGAFRVHGLSNDFLKDKSLFADIQSEFLDFVQGAELVIHNANFDVGFINAELRRIKHPKKLEDYCRIIDTLELARKKHPGQKNNLDILCKRYQIDATDRVLHGALLDAQLLADVYIAMTSGQKELMITDVLRNDNALVHQQLFSSSPVLYANEAENTAHADFLTMLQKKSTKVIWNETQELV